MKTENIQSVYFVGAGGIGMSALVRYFLAKNIPVAGYDRVRTALTDTMTAEGACLHFEDNPSLIPDAFKDKESTLVVYTPAVPNTHQELNYFLDNGFDASNVFLHCFDPHRIIQLINSELEAQIEKLAL